MALFVLAVLVCHRRDHTNVAPIHIMSSVIAACNQIGAWPCTQRTIAPASIELFRSLASTHLKILY